jgi:ABC-type nitrate/sulfonate/bicarbonate transport system substrate-binding protein
LVRRRIAFWARTVADISVKTKCRCACARHRFSATSQEDRVLLQASLRSYFRACFEHSLAAAAPLSQPPTVRLAIISEGVNTWPLYVAQEKKLFLQEGVEVAVTLTRFSVKQLAALKAGEFDIGFQQCDHIVRGVEEGCDLFMFMALAHAPELSLVVAPGIRSFDDLRGKAIAVDGARSGYALLLKKLLTAKGLASGDYVFREIGGSRERHDALKDDSVAASLLNPPFDRNLFTAGFGSLGTTGDYVPTYTGSIAATRRSWAKKNEATLISFIRGMNAALRWLSESKHRAEAIDILRSRLDADDAMAASAFEQFAQRAPPEIREEGLRQVIDVVWDAEGLALPKAEPEKYVDLTYFERARRRR